ncbi:MAG: LysM peptidoglycan-binding domain-containing protein [Phycisphaerales bacterium]
MTQETKSALLIGFIFIMIVLVVVVDGFDAGRTPALNDAPTDELPIVPPAEDDSFQRSQPPASGQIETAQAQVERYEVKRGDTLSGICAEYYGDAGLFPALQKANGLKSPDLVPGQTISLPPRAALTSNSPQTAPPPQTAQPEQPAPTETVRKNRTYTVQKGDMLERIARRELGDGRRANEIFEMNRDQLSSPDDIQPGMVLKLPE